MSDIAGGKAISANVNGHVEELRSVRAFGVKSGSNVYLVTFAVLPGTIAAKASCTCRAGQAGTPCWHVRAARLNMRTKREQADAQAEPEPTVGDLEPDRFG